MGECATMLFLTLTIPNWSSLLGSAGTREIRPCSTGGMATPGLARAFVSFLMGRWGSTWSGKRMQDGTQPQRATALSVVSTKENFSYVCMVGVNSHFKVLVFLCWAAWIMHLFILTKYRLCIHGWQLLPFFLSLCDNLDKNTCMLYFWLNICYTCN